MRSSSALILAYECAIDGVAGEVLASITCGKPENRFLFCAIDPVAA
ncbi:MULTISPECIES: hypothetical protein [unclassified Microcoleus]